MGKTIKLSDVKTEAEMMDIATNGYNRSVTCDISSDVRDNEKSSSAAEKITRAGPKTIEGRLRALSNLRNGSAKKREQAKSGFDPDNPVLSFLLNDDEVTYYLSRKAKYEEDYELNGSADEALLDQILIEEVLLNRLHYRQKEYYEAVCKGNKPKITDPSDEITAARKRFKDALQLFGGDRKTRNASKDKENEDNIASLALRLDKKNLLDDDTEAVISAIQKEGEKFICDSEEKRNKVIAELKIEQDDKY